MAGECSIPGTPVSIPAQTTESPVGKWHESWLELQHKAKLHASASIKLLSEP